MYARDRRLLLCSAFVAVAVLGLLVHGAGAEALLAAPFLALVAPLLVGHYLGEDHIERLAAGRLVAVHTVARARRTAAALRAPRVLLPRGGRLLATSLAVRPPPAFTDMT
jgi:hypothetical protein